MKNARKVQNTKEGKRKDTWTLGGLSFRKPIQAQSPIEPFHPCSLSVRPHPTVMITDIRHRKKKLRN